jgi:hypothetical protein
MALHSPETIVRVLRLSLGRLERKESLKPNDPALIKAKRNIVRLITEFELRNSKAA